MYLGDEVVELKYDKININTSRGVEIGKHSNVPTVND